VSTIGIIDDDVTTRTLLKTLLEMEGYAVIAFDQENARELLAALSNQRPDLVLLDVHLRYADGLELLRHIRQNQTTKNLRVVMSSGMDYSSQCEKAGANAFLMKPYMPDDLLAIIHEQLSQQSG
jgi:CheY-like chemotaxis protein